MVIIMSKRKILLNILKTLFFLVYISLYVFIITKIYKNNIWIYKSFVLLMVLILIIYITFKILTKIIPVPKQIIAKLVNISEKEKIVIITYQFLDEQYDYEVEFYEYDQNKYFKYGLDKWYTIIVKNNKVVKLLDPSQEPTIDKKEIEKKKYKETKFGLHIYMYYIFEFLFLIGLIMLPVEIVLTKIKINIAIIMVIEIINIVLFIFNSVLLNDFKKPHI